MKQINMRLILLLFVLLGVSDLNAQENKDIKINPVFLNSGLPFQAPAFDKIKDADFAPAIEAGMKQQLEEVKRIVENPAAASFENTIIPLEKSGQLLTRVEHVFQLLARANTNPALQNIEAKETPKLSVHADAIYLNTKLFKRIETIYEHRNDIKRDPESRKLIEFEFQQFLKAGAKLSNADKKILEKLNKEEAELENVFGNKLRAAANKSALILSDSGQLAGLSKNNLAAFAQKALENNLPGKWVIPLQNTTQQPALQSLSNRKTREALFNASWNRAESGDTTDTRQTIIRLAQIRAKKAKLLGFSNYATWTLQDQMASTPAIVDSFLSSLAGPSTKQSRLDATVLQGMIDKQNEKYSLEAWDWDYYTEQLRKEKYDLDDNEVKPYFELNRVLEDGVFYAANQLYGFSFKERHDLPVYQKDVRVFEVFDEDNKSIALFYCDYFKRDNKAGGAWMGNFVAQSYLLNLKPVVYNICNITHPAPGEPALLSYDNVRSMFHEFGHALHGMMAAQKYPSLSGTAVARDFVELPSQFNEHWATDTTVFKHYAVHYKTGKPMPQKLIDKIKKASTFNQAYKLTEALAASVIDMKWHELNAGDSVQDVDEFEKMALVDSRLYMSEVPTRYRSSYFSHIWEGGYAAGYYAYTWTKMLSEDIYSWFEENGGLTRKNGQRLRDMILSRGNTIEYQKMFKDFRGHPPQIGPLMKFYGLTPQ
jgi:peptidyl-dipeptidase Dcp